MENIKNFSSASWISAPNEMLDSCNRPKEENFPDASYIWPFGCNRFHAYRLFTPVKEVVKAEVAFFSDNLLDIWLNGKQIAENIIHLPLMDVTAMVTEGENHLHIRGYQSGTFETFSSAMTGGLRLYYADGSMEEIVTDGQFKQVQLVDFWETEEPEGFETETRGRRVSDMNVMQMHPIALRRSCYFIRPFFLETLPVSAKLYSTALGCYEPYVNGQRISDSFFMPFCQNVRKEYQIFDVLAMLRRGNNTLGMVSGNGSYNCRGTGYLEANLPEVMAILELEYAEGEKEIIVTDENWLCALSPLTDNDIQYGERYDARLERTDWCVADVDISGFENVSARTNTDYPTLLEQNYPLIRRGKEYVLKEYRVLRDGTCLYDLGVCIAGRARVTFRNLSAGKQIRIRYCERLTEEGMPENGAYTTVYYQQDCAPGGRSHMFMRNMDVYTAKGAERETYECRFAYTGFRYLWLEGLDSADQLEELVAFELHNDLKETGEIITENDALNRIFQATKRSWMNNLFNGPTDCPTREKNFWNGDSQIFSHAACWLTDNSKFLARWTDNGIKIHPGPYAWEDETYEMPLTLYRFYGDREILKRRFPEMLALVEKRQEFPGMILPEREGHEYCDWLSPTGISPNKKFFCGCWHYHMLDSVAHVAQILGEEEICKKLRDKADAAREEFNRRHLVDDGRDYDARNQCGVVLPLAFGIAPSGKRAELATTLVRYIEEADYHVTTGFVGTRFLFEVLADYGYQEVAYKVLTNRTCPSWLDMLSTGATAITESWLGEKDPDKSLSMAHFSLGSVVAWFFEYLGGIRIRESAPGLSHIVLKPVIWKEIGAFAVRYQSIHGEIRVEWHFEGEKAVLNYQVPEGVTVSLECDK